MSEGTPGRASPGSERPARDWEAKGREGKDVRKGPTSRGPGIKWRSMTPSGETEDKRQNVG